jgi:glucan phosphoethanolaminetransferase (alkaline phosphatase superfamily)
LIEFFQDDSITLLEINGDVKSDIKDVNFIFILGESVRADHIQLNGYNRETNPKLSKRKNIISFSNLYTPLTYTVASVKQLLTNESIKDTIKSNELISLYSILNTINLNTYWIGNSTIVKSYEPIIMSNTYVTLIDKFRSIMSFNKALDEEMLKPFDSIFNSQKNQFITLHMTGSHWWYENRYSDEFRKFEPVIDSKHIPSLEKQEIINSYDNTLVYLDNFINEVIKLVENTNTIVMYVSDHGEILGENGKWLHAQVDESSKNPAFIIWYSDSFKIKFPEYVNNIIDHKNRSISTDFFYHSVLDFYKVQNFDYDRSKSIF